MNDDEYSNDLVNKKTLNGSDDQFENSIGYLASKLERPSYCVDEVDINRELQQALDKKAAFLARHLLDRRSKEVEAIILHQSSALKKRCKAIKKMAWAKGVQEGLKRGRKMGHQEGEKATLRYVKSNMVSRLLSHGFRPGSVAMLTGVPFHEVDNIAARCKKIIH